MKTTVDIADPLFEKARALAAREGTTLRALIEEGLQAVLERHAGSRAYRLRDARFKGRGRGMSPEFLEGGWERIRAAIYGAPD